LWRAEASAVVCAIWQPVTKANEADFGRPNISLAHSPHTCSTTASAGAVTLEAAFWSQVEVSQSAASATGKVPPITQPKKRPLPDPIRPPSASRTSSSITASGARPASGKGLQSRCCSSPMVAVGAIGRDGRESRKVAAWAAARSRTLVMGDALRPLTVLLLR
jgi:hypothetical protein